MESPFTLLRKYCLILVFIASFMVLLDGVESKDNIQPNCNAVQTLFQYQPEFKGSIPPNPRKGNDLLVCPKTQTCCTSSMEKYLIQTADRNFKALLNTTASQFPQQLKKQLQHFMHSLQTFVSKAENNTVKAFTSVNRNLTEKIAPIFHRQHGCFLNYIKRGGQVINVEEAFNIEFEELFYQFFYNFLSPASYKKNGKCLKLSMKSISPFGKIPAVVTNQASKLAKQLRFINSLLSDVFSTLQVSISNHNYTSSCLNAITRMNFCSSCSMVSESVRPCRDMCINVMKGCLAALADIGPLWRTFIAAFDDMTKQFAYITKLITLFEYYASNISLGMQIAVSSADSILDQARLLCDIRHPSDTADNLSHLEFPVAGKAISGDIEFLMAKSKLINSLQNLKNKLKMASYYFSDIPYKICLDADIVEKRKRHKCWNGSGVGNYSHQIISNNGTASQSRNPELDVSTTDNRHLVLNVSRQINELITKVMKKLPTLTLPMPTTEHSVDPTGSGCVGSGNLGSGCAPNDDDDDSDNNNENGSGSTNTNKDDDLTATEASYGASATAADDDFDGSSSISTLVTSSSKLYVSDYQTKLPIETTTSGGNLLSYNGWSLFGYILAIHLLQRLLMNNYI